MPGVDLLFVDGDVLTLAGQARPARVLAVDGGRIAYVGDRVPDSLRANARQVVELRGRALVPGFHDAHVQLGLSAAFARGLDVSAADLDAVGDIVRTWRRYEPDAAPILCHGLSEAPHGALPHRMELDRIEAEVPLMILRWDVRAACVNTPMLLELDLALDTPGYDGGAAIDEKTGTLTRTALWTALAGVSGMMPPSELVRGLLQVSNAALERGVTTLHCMEGLGFLRGREVATIRSARSAVRARLLPYHRSTQERHRSLGGHLVAVLDGPPGSLDALGGGGGHVDQDALDRLVLAAHKRGYQAVIGATGERAIEAALRAFERALRVAPQVDHRHRIDGAACATDEQIRRMADLGLTVTLLLCGPHSPVGALPARRLLDRGVLVAAGSGAPVGRVDPMRAFVSLMEAGLSRWEALSCLTADAARAGLAEGDTGTLTPGKRADLVLLSGSPLAADLATLRVSETYVDGQRVLPQPLSVVRYLWGSVGGRILSALGLGP